MGNSGAKDIKVATLNYSGITLSPFEFVSESNEAQMNFMNAIFIRLLTLEKIQMFAEGSICHQFNNPSTTERWRNDQWEKNLKDLAEQIRKMAQLQTKEANEKRKLWSLGQIDKYMHKERYTPLYRRDVGILNGISFIERGSESAPENSEENSRTFIGRWKKEYIKNERYVNFRGKKQPTDQQKMSCRVFDYLVYKTLVQYCYLNKDGKLKDNYIKIAWTATLDERNKDKKEQRAAVRRYEQLLETYFRKPYLKQQKKVERVLEIFKEHDVVFLQDVSSQLINSLKNERNINIITAQMGDCAILIKQNKFKVLYDEQKVFEFIKNQKYQKYQSLNYENFIYNKNFDSEKNEIKKENSNNEVKNKEQKKITAICFVDNFVLVSLHLTSSKKSKKKQAQLVFQHLAQIKTRIPQLKIIVGGDFNDFAYEHLEKMKQYNTQINIYPDNDKQYTTRKLRSWLQPQITKSGQPDQSCRDFLLSTNKMYQTNLSTYSSGLIKSTSEKLPSDEHPFDHYIVSAIVQRQ